MAWAKRAKQSAIVDSVCAAKSHPNQHFLLGHSGQSSSTYHSHSIFCLKHGTVILLVNEQRMPIEYPFHIPALRTPSTTIPTTWTMGDKRSASSVRLDKDSSQKVMSTDYTPRRQKILPGSLSWSSGRPGKMNKKFITLYFIIGLLATGKYLYSVFLTAFSRVD